MPAFVNNMVAPHPALYTLNAPVTAVKLGETLESRSATSGIKTIPAGSTLQIESSCTISGLIDVTWDGIAYAVFSVDLQERSTLAFDTP